MKRYYLSLIFLALFMVSGCGFKPNYTPRYLNGYVIDMLTTKSIEQESENRKEVYRYTFSEKTFKATSASYPYVEGTYRYELLDPQEAMLTCINQNQNNKANIMKLNFQDAKSGTWISYINNNIPGEEGGTFVIVQKGDQN